MNIHLKIQELRKKSGLSQEALAAQLGVSRQAVSKWESGINAPDIDNLLALSKIFGISVSELLTGEKEESAEVQSEAAPAVADEKYEELLQQHLLQVDAMLKNAQKKKRSGWRTFGKAILVLALVWLFISYADKMQRLENNINNLQSNMSHIRTDINSQIYSIQKEITDSLKKEYGLISDYSIDYHDVDMASRTVALDISASPRLWNDGDTLTFLVDSDGKQVSAEGVYVNGTVTASLTVPLSDYVEVSALIVNGGTTKQEKIDDLHELLSMQLLEVDGHGRISSTRTLGNDKLTISGDIYVNIHSRIYDESRPVRSRVKSAVFEFIENGKVTSTIDLLKESRPDFNFTEMYDFEYDIGTIERNIKVGDTFEYAVTVTDDNGVVYKGIVESIVVCDDLRVDHGLTDDLFEAILPEKAIDIEKSGLSQDKVLDFKYLGGGSLSYPPTNKTVTVNGEVIVDIWPKGVDKTAVGVRDCHLEVHRNGDRMVAAEMSEGGDMSFPLYGGTGTRRFTAKLPYVTFDSIIGDTYEFIVYATDTNGINYKVVLTEWTINENNEPVPEWKDEVGII
ncbi:MAG: helix-turn-helix transcriptional regulator [Clostridia bacterium]|nr:helix-turn-helix transcriptional regulator [Clostridia bacterium]